MKKNLMILLLIYILTSVNAQIKTDTMIEKFNYQALKEGTIHTSFYKGDWLIDIWSSSMDQLEYAPAKDFYVIEKKYHKNGVLESIGKRFGKVPFGIWEYFDENGQLIKTIDEDAKFGKIKPTDLVTIIEKVGWMNRQTGENIIVKSPLKTDGTFYAELIQKLDIYFSPAQYSKTGQEIEPPMWSFGYLKHSLIISYFVNGNTGVYELHETPYYMEY